VVDIVSDENTMRTFSEFCSSGRRVLSGRSLPARNREGADNEGVDDEIGT
jgi:hypothetical protein